MENRRKYWRNEEGKRGIFSERRDFNLEDEDRWGCWVIGSIMKIKILKLFMLGNLLRIWTGEL